ncbi:hypothetical protein SEA_CLOWN_65 [Gordonia phage Clown]|uniref:Uncharacterized protein n=1 Tax=Gordonia phage Clown TaxID=2759393 RepID=A0A7L7SI01_9CAUD|nr:hypothetical protein KNV25_gp65 [Gordonia phage Clown]QOC56063.1 hypothetical protein SEA_CLOWN_65 [Gordonia phage Clown]
MTYHFRTIEIACDSGCGREVSLTVAEEDPDRAYRAACRRLVTVDGWSDQDGMHCRACSLIRAGWAAAPGPNQSGHDMTLESVTAPDVSDLDDILDWAGIENQEAHRG